MVTCSVLLTKNVTTKADCAKIADGEKKCDTGAIVSVRCTAGIWTEMSDDSKAQALPATHGSVDRHLLLSNKFLALFLTLELLDQLQNIQKNNICNAIAHL